MAKRVILVVDDKKSYRMAVSKALKTSGFSVVEASHGGMAAELFDKLSKENTEIAAIVTDQEMAHIKADGRPENANAMDGDSWLKLLLYKGNTLPPVVVYSTVPGLALNNLRRELDIRDVGQYVKVSRSDDHSQINDMYYLKEGVSQRIFKNEDNGLNVAFVSKAQQGPTQQMATIENT